MTAKKPQTDNLLRCMTRLTAGLDQLKLILEQEHQSLTDKSIEQLPDIATRKSGLAEQLNLEHAELNLLATELSTFEFMNPDFIAWAANESEQLEQACQKIKGLTDAIEQANIVNGQLLNRQVNRNRLLMRLLSGNPEENTYSDTGKQGAGLTNSTIGSA